MGHLNSDLNTDNSSKNWQYKNDVVYYTVVYM